MYQVTKTSINTKHELYGYCSKMTSLSRSLYNASLFRVRNIFTGFDKESLSDLEKEVFSEVLQTEQACNCKIRNIISYNSLEKMMRITANPDFFAGLPMQSAQAMVKKAVTDFQNWKKALRKYHSNSFGFTGKPQMPHYIKSEKTTCYITNQDAVYKNGYLKLPLIKTRMCLPKIPENAVLKEVKIKPYYNDFLILCTFEVPDVPVNHQNTHVAAIDFGVDNIAAFITDEGHSFLYKGGAIKSCNQYFNKSKAELVSVLTKGHSRKNVSSHKLRNLSRKRDCFINDQLHKISKSVIDNCIKYHVGTIILGVNKGMKQHSNIGKANNQAFASIPLRRLAFMITYKAQRAGITVLEQEESYTSKADFLCGDYIPVYGKDDEKAVFSGERIKRGLYKSGSGIVLNADLNGAANIMKKAGIEVSEMNTDAMQNPIVFDFRRLNSKSIPVKGIAAAM